MPDFVAGSLLSMGAEESPDLKWRGECSLLALRDNFQQLAEIMVVRLSTSCPDAGASPCQLDSILYWSRAQHRIVESLAVAAELQHHDLEIIALKRCLQSSTEMPQGNGQSLFGNVASVPLPSPWARALKDAA